DGAREALERRHGSGRLVGEPDVDQGAREGLQARVGERRLRDGDGAAAKQLDVAAGVGVGAGVGVAAGVRVAAAAVAIVVAAGGGAEDREGPGENVGETTVSENLHGKALLAWAHPRRGSPVR